MKSSCNNCKLKGICYRFNETYIPVADKLKDMFGTDEDMEKALHKVKEAIAKRCGCWELEKWKI